MSQERLVSPAVFTNERDLTFLPQGIGNIGASMIGPTMKGRAFIPTTILTNTEFTTKFGGKNDESYVPYCVESYLQSAGTVTIIRLLGMNGYKENVIPLVINTNTGNYLASVLHPTYTVDSDTSFKNTFLTNTTFSSSYNAYSYSGGAMTSLNTTINRTGSITVTVFNGTIVGEVINSFALGTIVSASNANLYVSGSLSGSVIGTAIGLFDGVDATHSLWHFSSSFQGNIYGTTNLAFLSHPTITGSVSSATVVGNCGISVGTISGSLSSGSGTVSASFTSSIAPQSAGDAFVSAGNILYASDFFMQIDENMYNLSLKPTSANYIGKLYGYNPKTTLDDSYADDKDRAYNYLLFKNNLTSLLSTDPNATLTTASVDVNFEDDSYSPASTPWVASQIIAGKAHNLFKAISISDGVYANTEVKIGILNVKKSGEIGGTDYGSFDLVVRVVSDNDRQQQVVETYSGLSLDPKSANYICRIIGDKYPEFTTDKFGMSRITMKGDYNNKSAYIRIQVDENVKFRGYDPSLVPFGFKAYQTPFDATGLGSITIPAVNYVTTQSYNNEYSSRVYYGFNSSFTTTDNMMYLMPIPSGSTTGSNADFNLDNMIGHPDSGFTGSISDSGSLLSQRKFMVALQGGFDGWSPSRPKLTGEDITATNVMGFDCSIASSEGAKIYNYAINLLSNSDQYDLNLLVTPGVLRQLHPSVIQSGIDMCEGREDVFYIFDLAKLTETNLNTLTGLVDGMDTNYAATYHPWLKILNTDDNNELWVTPSTLLAGVLAYNDKIGYEWYAPAGLNRGGLTEALDVYQRLYQTDRDTLYEGRINPIASFPKEGIVVWGQKTLQADSSALDRISVRRLLIAAKKYIASSCRYLVFEQNVSATRNKFLNFTNPYLDSIQQRNGLYSFNVKMDEQNNKQDVIDKHILYGQIWLQPSSTAEIIVIDFNITPNGASFSGQ
jgi:hypothetical protein